MSGIILIIFMIAFMYFFMMRPQQKQRKEHQEMVNSLQPGDEVVTIGRLHGVVSEVNASNQTVTIDCEGIYLTFDLNAIARVNRPTAAPASNENSQSESTSESTSETASETSEEVTSESESETKAE
ncbi:preprotein translocase subunit YajC [Limosilactobacillus gastricus]|uniref:Translocase subunit yajC n=1 Tax=Limosilactobacillus gastricus DSM 16045 TaxID=1423749 RepID=A0A0R1VKD1_9LACO|nr:preprotein translocase subunit YajC [Limosilactobacillus gastricus]KRM03481.1 Translocase subunit yajC [Limosilactobacillus gastricus DSM 16045]QGF41268.1 preprotein translocase subunit YajC [Limosilactobacillus gastricus]